MKRFIPIILALLLLVTLTGCAELNAIISALADSGAAGAPAAAPDIPDLVLYDPEAEEAEQTSAPAAPERTPDSAVPVSTPDTAAPADDGAPDEDGEYDSKTEVAAYIAAYGRLPANYITKDEARRLGWDGGSLEPYAPGKCIGGDRFGNYEGLLPEKKGRSYTECDIGTRGKKSRGAKRIVFSNDGLIYYTGDHYDSFTLLYGEE